MWAIKNFAVPYLEERRKNLRHDAAENDYVDAERNKAKWDKMP